jgi:hypothetical protein
MNQIIKVYYSNDKGEIVSQSYSGANYTVDTAEESMRKHGFTVIYSTVS